MFRLGRQRGRRQADHSVVRHHYFCLGARYIQELFLSADTSEAVCRYDQCKYPCYQRCHRAKTSPSSAHHNLRSFPPFRPTRRNTARRADFVSPNETTSISGIVSLRYCARLSGQRVAVYPLQGGFLAETRGRTIRFMRHAATK
jgi:hypothetical protein